MTSTVFISYSHIDERAVERLHKHLAMLQRDGLVSTWFDRAILPGADFGQEIRAQLNASSIFLALASPDYLASNYCYDEEFKYALGKQERGEMRLVPVILEPCDWLSSPLQKFMALPKDGKPISEWTNGNSAYLDVVTGLRRLVTPAAQVRTAGQSVLPGQSDVVPRRVRLKRDFDVIERADFADQAFKTMRDYFRAASLELAAATEDLRTKLEDLGSGHAFTCTIVNRARRGNRDAHITVFNRKGRHDFGDISYLWESHGNPDSSNGSIRVDADEYDLFLTVDRSFDADDAERKLTADRAAEWLWNKFVGRAGVEYE